MKRDAKTADEKRGQMRCSAKAHWLLASVTKRQAQLHRELAMLLDKEAEAHVALERLERGLAAGGQPANGSGAPLEGAYAGDREARLTTAAGNPIDLRAAGVARVEARAHRDLALRADARTLWHKTVTALLLRSGMWDGLRVNPPGALEATDDNDTSPRTASRSRAGTPPAAPSGR